jgi:hypothetical protein
MAYVTVCEPCLDFDCENCKQWEMKLSQSQIDAGFIGGGVCLCQHGKAENEWVIEVRQRAAEQRKS